MNASFALLMLCSATVLASCADRSYHDANGIYRSGTIKDDDFRHERNVMAGSPNRVLPMTPVTYGEAGYYDRRGSRIAAMDGGPRVERQYHPPKGMCRLWFIDRVTQNQPKVDSCANVHTAVPAGAYVMYGG